MRIPNWKELLSSVEHVAFDESAFSHMFIRHKNWPTWLSNLVKPLYFFPRRTENIEAFTTPYASIPWTDGSKAFPATWYWDNGQLMNDKDKGRHFPYFHFMMWKQGEWRKNGAATRTDYASLAARRLWQISAEGFSERQ